MLFPNVKICFSTTQLLLLTIFGQTVILGFAWGFTGGVLFEDVIPLSDYIVHLIVEYPTVLTLVVTLISTALSIITSMFFTFAVKEALGHRLSGPITLFRLRTAIALSRPTWLLRWRFLKLSVLTLAIYVVVTLLNTSWSTLLLPPLLQWPVPMFGTELDLGSPAFINQLNVDLNAAQENSVQVPAFETINVLTLISGIVAIVVPGDAETSPIFSFNGAAYNRTTGGVLSVIEEYSGSSNPASGVGLSFSGGKVPVNTSFDWGRHGNGSVGIAKNYTVTQQGVTADVTCQPIDRSQNSFGITSTTTQGSVYSFFTWNATANCSGNSNSQTYFTIGNAAGQISPAFEGFIPVVVCPSPGSTSSTKFDIFLSGLYKYEFLPTTVCEVVPYLTTVNVTYNEGLISVDWTGTSSGLTDNSNLPLSQYIANVISYQMGSNQGMTLNTIGDFLSAYGNNNVSEMYSELNDYFRGIAEFASTQLRSGYSVGNISSNMTRPTSGTMYIATYGWRSQYRTFILVLVVITIIWGATVFAAGYSIIQERHNPSDPSFDFSNPIHLVIAASGGGPEGQLDISQAGNSEDITVRFVDGVDKEGRRTSRKLVSA
ncbi:hypothetical protein DFH29DRAFT_1075158 [Suillus ampliporus]|nr:hypothetical protein DFH29DRAFT_1075158 [Suillus ampliporus]